MMDYDRFSSEWQGDRQSFLEIVNKMIGRFNADLDELGLANQSSNSEQIKFLAHKFKFFSKFFYANELQVLIQEIEEAHHNNQADTVIKLGERMQVVITEINLLLKSKIET